jgi:hypothetical protein
MSDYPSSARTAMLVSLKDIQEAFEFVCGGGEHQAFLCKQSGKLYCHSGLCDDLDMLPDDIGDSEKFLQIPDKRELDLGKPLALDFARQFLPGDFDDVLLSARSETLPKKPVCVADETVCGEPVCGSNSLLTGNITGNFTKIGPFGESVPVKMQQNQLVAN